MIYLPIPCANLNNACFWMLTGLPCKRRVNSIDGMHEFVSKYIEILIAEKVFSIDTSTRYFCLCIFNDTLKGRAFLLGHKHTFFESVFHSWGLSFGWLTLVNEHWLYFYFRLILIYWTTLYFDFTSINFFHFVAIWEQNIFTPELDSVYTFLRDNNLRLSICVSVYSMWTHKSRYIFKYSSFKMF